MATGELPRPGVEVLQTFKSPAPSFVRPTLVPCVVGPAFEVIDVLTTAGGLNPKARFGTYAQMALAITESSFPDPRENIDELDIIESSIKPYMYSGKLLNELKMSPGQSFLAYGSPAGRACIRSKNFSGPTGLDLNGKVLVLAIDVPARADKTKDVVITFLGAGNLTAAQAAEQINEALGFDAATVVGEAPNDQVQIASLTYGALSSVTVRAGGSANETLDFTADKEERVEGYGWRGQDDNNPDTVTPWIEYFIGAYLLDGAATAIPASSNTAKCIGFLNGENDDAFEAALKAEVTFGDAGTVPLKVGDFFYADGIRVKSGEVSKIEAKRFKVGTINPTLSTADEDGNYTSKVYDVQQVSTLFDANPFAPRYTYFRANGLVWDKLAPVAAAAKGGISANPAVKAYVDGGVIDAGTAVTGTTIHYVSTIDGVENEGTVVFPAGGPYDLAGLVTAINALGIPGVLAKQDDGGTKIRLESTTAGRLNGITVKYDGTANALLGFSTSVDTTAVGTDASFPALLTTAGQNASLTGLTGTHIDFGISTDGGVTFPAPSNIVVNFGSDPANLGALVTVLNEDAGFAAKLVAVAVGTELRVYAKPGTTVNGVKVLAASSCLGAGAGKISFTADASARSLTGATLKFQFDSNPHIFTVELVADSLDQAIDEINEKVGAVVAAKDATGLKLVLTSTLKGKASKVGFPTTGNTADGVFKLSTGTLTAGSGRPLPDAFLDAANVLNIQSQILRDLVTGYPLDQASNSGTLYIQFRALRLDVSAVAANPGVLRLSDITTLSAVLDPLTEANPLGLAMYLMMVNAPTFECKGLGIDEVTAGAPEGTEVAYARAASLLEAEEVYALAPLTQNEVVHGMWITHSDVMSEPEQGGERIVFINKKMPVRKNSVIALSGLQANTTTNDNEFVLDNDPTPGLVAAGVRGPAIAEGLHVYLEVTVGGELRRYSVSNVAGAVVTVRTAFASADTNLDGFYSTVKPANVVNSTFSLKVRGASLVIPGSNPPRLDYSLVADTVAEANATIHNRRCYSVFPDTVKTTIGGVEKALPGFYACAGIAGMVASKPPQQPFTNYPMTGYTGVSGTEKFTKRQLNRMAGGGTYILIQDAIGAPVTCRHQLSTNTNSIEERELSITKVVDFTAKFLRLAVRKFIGINVINNQLLDSLGTTVHAVLKFLEEAGVLNGSAVNNILQDATNKDTVLIDVTLDVPFPCNYIRLTLVV
jgi:hypothetical protein